MFMLPLSCYREKLSYLSHLICGLQICQIWIQSITACGEYCKRRCIKYASLIHTNWNSDWERSGPTQPNWIMSLFRQPFCSGVVDSSRSVILVLYTSCNISHTLLSTGFKSGEFGGHRCSWNKFWSFSLLQLNCGVPEFPAAPPSSKFNTKLHTHFLYT